MTNIFLKIIVDGADFFFGQRDVNGRKNKTFAVFL